MKAEQNQRITQVGPGTPGGELLRRYWQPVALLDEFNPALDPAMGVRPVKALRVLGQDFVLFKNAQGAFGLLDRDCPHRGADLAFGRNEGDGLRCPFHGWKLKKAKNGDWLYCPYRKEFCDVAWERESYGQNLEGRLADNILLEGLCVGG